MKTLESFRIEARGEREIVMTRDFDAPRALVFEAWTKPELLRRWLGVFGGWSLDVCEVDLRVGGAYRWVWHKGEIEMGMGGVYQEIAPPDRLVTTETFDDPWYPGGAVATTVFTEKAGVTTVTLTMKYDTRDARDGVLQSDMQRGMVASYDKLAELLAAARAS